MRTKLKKITDLTINELLIQEIILPSNYLQCFDKHAKLTDVDLNDEKFEKEINELLLHEFDQISNYVTDATKTVEEVASVAKNAQEAIKNKDESALKVLYKQIDMLKHELEDMTESIYRDYLTKSYNKKWLYQKFLKDKVFFRKSGIIVLLDIIDYNYIVDNYNKFIADNLLIFASKYLNEKLKEEGFDFKMVRFINDKFIIYFNDNDKEHINSFLTSLKSMLLETTLKSNSGVLIKPKIDFTSTFVSRNESFHDTLEALFKEIKKN